MSSGHLKKPPWNTRTFKLWEWWLHGEGSDGYNDNMTDNVDPTKLASRMNSSS